MRLSETTLIGGDVSGRFNQSFSKERLLRPGEVSRWSFDRFWFTCRRIEAGSRIRLVLGPVDRDYLQKNWQTGSRIGFEVPAQAKVARVKLHHSKKHPSRLLLPIRE